jgi:hypothetical protein
MDSARILQLRNHLMRQSEERRAFLITEGLRLADEDIAARIKARVRAVRRHRNGRAASPKPHSAEPKLGRVSNKSVSDGTPAKLHDALASRGTGDGGSSAKAGRGRNDRRSSGKAKDSG